MKIKGIFCDRSPFFQLFLLLLLVVLGATVSTLISSLFLFTRQGLTADINLEKYANTFRIIQLTSAVGTFLLPALAFAYLCSNNPFRYLSIKKIASPKVWIISFCSILLISPTITLLGIWNEQLVLPDFLSPIEEWMRNKEDLAKHFTQIILSGEGLYTLLANLVVVAAAAGLTEEFLFRGALQRILGKCTTNPHIIIWLTAILFSTFHLQFYGFVPRMLLGAYLGYLLYWSKSIWLPVFAHFTNNAIAVIGNHSCLKDCALVSGDIQPEHYLSFGVMAVGSLLLFLVINRQLKRML